jgi:predicted transcriptional regulator
VAQPQGSLTPNQVEIMEVVWAAGEEGATIAQIWQALSARRAVARTTVLTQVTRLENRHWLVRRESDHGIHFVAARSKETAAGQIAARFVQEMFGGSASGLVRSLLGSDQITPEELRRLRELLDQAKNEDAP